MQKRKPGDYINTSDIILASKIKLRQKIRRNSDVPDKGTILRNLKNAHQNFIPLFPQYKKLSEAVESVFELQLIEKMTKIHAFLFALASFWTSTQSFLIF